MTDLESAFLHHAETCPQCREIPFSFSLVPDQAVRLCPEGRALHAELQAFYAAQLAELQAHVKGQAGEGRK